MVVGPRLIFSSLHGKSNYSSPYAIAFGATIPFYSRLKSLNSSRVPLEFFNFLVNLVDVIRETNNLASRFSFGLGKQPKTLEQVGFGKFSRIARFNTLSIV